MYAAGIIEIIVTLPTGIALIILGLLLWKKQKIQLLHDYHYKNVKQQDIKAYTRLWGTAMIIFGGCICPIGIIDTIFRSGIGWILFVIGIVICFMIGNKAQKTYNGSWFS